MTSTGPLVSAHQVLKNYQALRPLRLEKLVVSAGEVVSLVGLDAPAAEMLVGILTGAIVPDSGEVRLFGVVMESSDRGVSYDSLGVNGAFIGLLSNYMDGEHWIEQLRRRNPDLVILGYGANESEFENWPMDQYEQDTREVVRRIHAALPEVSILFVAPMDRGKRGAGGQVITRPTIPKLVAAQRKLAAETGCAFFDTFTAMGGEGTVARWREARPRLMGGDYLHPTAEGAEIVGALLYNALLKAYEQSKPSSNQPTLAARNVP